MPVSTRTLPKAVTGGFVALRNEPVQARSAARLTGLLDAAAAVIDEFGYERLTTAMVAEEARASIGTVYRYFPDRIAVLQALAARNLDRTLDRVTSEISDEAHADWAAALFSAIAIFVEAFRSEPSFRSLRVGDVIDLRPYPNQRTFNSMVAEAILAALVSRFALPVSEQTRFVFECAVEVSDAMAARAFVFDSSGEEAYLDQGRAIVYSMLVGHFGAAEGAPA
jgi:AcrR family transcriptional regulator